MGPSIAVLGVLVAVLAAMLRWELPSEAALRQAAVDRAVQNDFTALKTKPRVKNKIKVQRIRGVQDNSNSSYAALGLRASFVPAEAPSWMHRAGGRLEAVNRSVTSSLKDLARKSILGPVS